MLFTTEDGKSFDTQADLTAPERHILQKLFLWETMASTLKEFKEKKDAAFGSGWNDSGPITESPAMRCIISELLKRVTARLTAVD